MPRLMNGRAKAAKGCSKTRGEMCLHRWPVLGLGEIDFGVEIDWLRDPLSGMRWRLEYHGDVALLRGDGSDVRILWEINRLGHLLTPGLCVCGDR